MKIIFAVLSLTIFFCNPSYGQTKESDISNVRARLIICSELSEKNIPLNNLKEITIKGGQKVYFYVKWFNLSVKKHISSIDILDADNNYLAQSSNYKFKPKRRTHNTWNSRKFREIFIPEGIIKIRVMLDEQIILEKEVPVKYLKNNLSKNKKSPKK